VRLRLDGPADPGAYPFRHEVRVRFAETDAMAVVHHAAYLPYLEEARVGFLRAQGHPYGAVRDGGVEFPVLEVYLAYARPVRFDEVLTVALRFAWVRASTFQIDYLLSAHDGVRAHGSTLHAAVAAGSGRPVRAPRWLADLASGPSPR
jgi:acyl-CoA thioester hydrolase